MVKSTPGEMVTICGCHDTNIHLGFAKSTSAPIPVDVQIEATKQPRVWQHDDSDLMSQPEDTLRKLFTIYIQPQASECFFSNP